MTTAERPRNTARAIDLILRISCSACVALAATTPSISVAQTALDTVTVTIPEESHKPSTDITVVKEQTASGFIISVTNTGPEAVSGVIVSDSVGRGPSCRPTNPVAIAASGSPAGASSTGGKTIANLTGQGIALGTLNSGQTATLTFTCQGN